MTAVSIHVTGAKELERKITPDLYLRSVHDVLRDASTYATREAQREAGRDIGAIARTIGADVISPMEVHVRSRHPGALAAEFGRNPGTPAPPISALEAWASRHGASQFVFQIARAISRRGIKGRFFMRQARERLERSEMPRLLRRAANEIERRWSA